MLRRTLTKRKYVESRQWPKLGAFGEQKRPYFSDVDSFTEEKNEGRDVSTLYGDYVSGNPASRSFTAES